MSKVATAFTWIDGWFCQIYHQTIVTKVNGNKVQIFSGGWQTSTTKRRINDVIQPMGWTLFQKDFNWFVSPHNDWSTELPFTEGMELIACK